MVLWATDRAAYGRLARLITRGCRRAEKGQCRLTFDDVAEHAAGLLAGVVAEFGIRNSEFGEGEQPRSFSAFRIPNSELSRSLWRPLLSAGRAAPRAGRPAAAGPARELSRRSRVPLVAAGDVHYHVPQRQALATC